MFSHSSQPWAAHIIFDGSTSQAFTFGAMRILAILFLTTFSVAVFAQQSMSLEQCIEQALQKNLQVKQTELSLEASEANLQSTRANRLPNLNGFAAHNYNWGQRIDPFTNQFANTRVQSNSFGLSSDVVLFNGFQNQQNIKTELATMQSASYDLEASKNDMALAVSSSFLSVLLTEELIAASEQQVQISKQQLDRVKKMVAAGSANMGMQYELEAQLARDRSTLTQRQNDYALAMLQLKQLMLMPADESLVLIKSTSLEADSTIRLENSATVYGYAEGAMPEIKRAEYSLMRWEHQMESAKGNRYPTLTLSGSVGTGYSGLRTDVESYTYTGDQQIGFTEEGQIVYTQIFDPTLVKVPFATQLNDNFNQFVGLSLNVPIFNRMNVNNAIQQAQINRSIAELQLEQEKQGLRQRIESARADAVAARELYKSNEQTVLSSEKALEFATARFEAGALNVTEFNTSKNNLLIARAQVARAKYDFVFKSKVLDFYMGKPLGFE